jgi:hypothetical protein
MLYFKSKIGDFELHIKDVFMPQREKYSFYVVETGKTFLSECGVIRYARAYLKRERKKWKLNNKKVQNFRTKRTRKFPVK